MKSTRELFCGPRWLVGILVGAVLAGAAAGAALAGEQRHFVLRDGTKVPLIRSTSELGIVFKSAADVDAGRQWLEESGLGAVEDIADAPEDRVKVLRVMAGGDVLPGQVPAHDNIEEVRPVYRFFGFSSPVLTSGTMVVKVRGNLTASQLQGLWAEHGVGDVRPFAGLRDVYLVKPARMGADEVLIAEEIADDWRTLWANPDLRVAAKPQQVNPADKYFKLQWHLENAGTMGMKADADIDALGAWPIADGEGVLFGMLDEGCDVDHEDLASNYIGTGQDISVSPLDSAYNDPRPKESWEAHGTAVMGLAVSAANSVGVRGVAYRARFTASRGLGQYLYFSDIAAAYTFALRQNVDVHINSWGYPIQVPVVVDAIETAFKEGRDPDGKDGPEPPRGMVIVFAMGNTGTELESGDDFCTLPYVLGVGASTDQDERASYSSYGVDLDFMAPGAGTQELGIVTADNEDRPDQVAKGYNVDGSYTNPETGEVYWTDIDPTGSYSGYFGGTSAACPIAAGVAGLILSVNPKLTATDVRIIMEHTCDQIADDDALYSGITSKSLKYGHGRINAEEAVKAARGTLNNGGWTWPDVPGEVRVEESTLKWKPGVGTDDYLVLESLADFTFYPEDGVCYDQGQRGCESAEVLGTIPEVADVIYTGCEAGCGPDNEQAVEILRPPVGSKVFAIYGRNVMTGRYSFGGMAEVTAAQSPRVTIVATPLEGTSPLTVSFNGNAVAEYPIDPSRTTWDFDVDDDVAVDATTPAATYVFLAPDGETVVFTAKLTMYDTQGNAGSSQILIHVTGPGVPSGSGGVVESSVRIIIGVPGTPGSNVSSGTSPFSVELSIDATQVSGTLQSISWDLGDGTKASSLTVPHTYMNESNSAMRFPITATVTTVASGGTVLRTTSTRLITIEPGEPVAEAGNPQLPGAGVPGANGTTGGSASPCGSVGMVPLICLFGTLSLTWLRRRSRCG